MTGPLGGFVDAAGTRLRVWEWGSATDPTVICLHGAFDHGRMWDGLAPEMATLGLHVVAPDLRGHGDSERLRSGHIWVTTALDIASLARHYGAPVGLIGHSFGGGQALTVAAAFPELVRWVVNIDGLGPPPEAFEDERDLRASAAEGIAAAERVLAGNPRRYASLEEMAARRGSVNGRLPPEWVRHLVEHGAVRDGDGYVWKSDPMFRVGFPDDFSLDYLLAEYDAVRAPVLAITGAEHDTWSEMTHEQLRVRIARLGDVRHHVVEGAGHYVHLEQLEATRDLILSFLGEVDVG